MNTLQALRELLNSESATIEDCLKYAKGHFESLKADKGADEYAELFVAAIEKNIPFKDLSYTELQKLSVVAQAIIKQKEATLDEDAYPFVMWGSMTNGLIQEELKTRLESFPNTDFYSWDYLKLLFTIKISNDIQSLHKNFKPLYTEHCENFLFISQNQLVKLENSAQTSQDSNYLELLKKEQDFLKKTDISAEKKIERYSKMYEELTLLEGLLDNYKEYVEQTYTDNSKPAKEALIASLNEIIKDPDFPLGLKMYSISKLISQPENQATLMQDSWGAKLLAAVRDFFSFLFPREQTHSEFYKERLLALKQEAIKTQENAPPDVQTSQTPEQNKGGMG